MTCVRGARRSCPTTDGMVHSEEKIGSADGAAVLRVIICAARCRRASVRRDRAAQGARSGGDGRWPEYAGKSGSSDSATCLERGGFRRSRFLDRRPTNSARLLLRRPKPQGTRQVAASASRPPSFGWNASHLSRDTPFTRTTAVKDPRHRTVDEGPSTGASVAADSERREDQSPSGRRSPNMAAQPPLHAHHSDGTTKQYGLAGPRTAPIAPMMGRFRDGAIFRARLETAIDGSGAAGPAVEDLERRPGPSRPSFKKAPRRGPARLCQVPGRMTPRFGGVWSRGGHRLKSAPARASLVRRGQEAPASARRNLPLDCRVQLLTGQSAGKKRPRPERRVNDEGLRRQQPRIPWRGKIQVADDFPAGSSCSRRRRWKPP